MRRQAWRLPEPLAIASDGSLVVKLYYVRDRHTVIYNANGHGTVWPAFRPCAMARRPANRLLPRLWGYIRSMAGNTGRRVLRKIAMGLRRECHAGCGRYPLCEMDAEMNIRSVSLMTALTPPHASPRR